MTLSPFEVVLYEGEGASSLDSSLVPAVMAGLLDRGYPTHRAIGGGTGNDQAGASDGLLVLGDFGGNPPELTDAGGAISIETRDISGLAADAILAVVEEARGERPVNAPNEKGSWKPWFPVIDYDRCTNCLQCLTFCLFDVYSVDDDKQITVQNNDNCKTNCPACSRVCPEVAIMFPKYQGSPINGAVVSEEDLSREKMKVDISSLLGGDIYSSLRNRSEQAKSRFSAERDSDKALKERKRCLTKLQADGMIPAEVLAELDLASLPSPEEIQKKAEEVEKLLEEQGD